MFYLGDYLKKDSIIAKTDTSLLSGENYKLKALVYEAEQQVVQARSESDLKLSNMDKLFQVIIKCAIFEFLYKPNTSKKIIIKEYLNASNFFIEDNKTKYLNALLDKISKNLRLTNE